MDAAGWADVEHVLRIVKIDRGTLERVVAGNNKSRFELIDGRIRASQGHTQKGTGVSLEELEASWRPFKGSGPIFHGTRVDAVESIARDGIQPVARTHVHLADAVDSQVGKRANVDLCLAVDPARLRERGIEVFASQNGVVLARQVPPECIVGLLPLSKKAKEREPELRAKLKI